MRYFVFLALFIAFGANAQWKSYLIGVKGDTLNRTDMQGRKQGAWVVQVPELRGEPGYEEDGYFLNDKKEGRWVRYSLQGDKLAAENFRWGQKDGRCEYYNNVEDLIRVESWRAIDPKNPYDTVAVTDPKDPTRILRYEVVKVESPSVKHGTWRYYDPQTGQVEKTEQWVLDRLKTKEEEETTNVATTDGSTPATTAKPAEKKAVAKPQAVLDFEKKNSGKKKVKMRDGSTGG